MPNGFLKPLTTRRRALSVDLRSAEKKLHLLSHLLHLGILRLIVLDST